MKFVDITCINAIIYPINIVPGYVYYRSTIDTTIVNVIFYCYSVFPP